MFVLFFYDKPIRKLYKAILIYFNCLIAKRVIVNICLILKFKFLIIMLQSVAKTHILALSKINIKNLIANKYAIINKHKKLFILKNF